VEARPLADEYQAFLECRPDLLADPFPLFARMRREAPIYRHPGQVVITRYEDVAAMLTDERFLVGHAGMRSSKSRAALARLDAAEREEALFILGFRERWLSNRNGDEHDRLRALAHKAFTPRVINAIAERVQQIADDLLSTAAAADGEIDLIADFAWQFPLIVISEMLDVPAEDRYEVREWSNAIMAFADGAYSPAISAGYAGARQFGDYLTRLFARRRGTDTTDLLGALLNAELEAEETFSDRDLVALVSQFLFAGHETTTNLIANGLNAMLGRFPDQWEMLCEDPALAARATEESFRYEVSAQQSQRVAAVACELQGVPIKQWDTVMLTFSAANRDPDAYENADTFDMMRTGPKHLGLGLGPHYCLGASLARLETTTAYATLARRFPDMCLTGGAVRTANHRLRGFDKLPVRLGRDAG
jgi:cytochrome P450